MGLNKKQQEAFAQFWVTYPKRRSKGQAERAWLALNPDQELLAKILITIGRAKQSREWKKDGGVFIPYPGTWLRAKGWEDEYVEPPLASERLEDRLFREAKEDRARIARQQAKPCKLDYKDIIKRDNL